jgi:pSer/pThr/pTyr-binding forkhead associated (FHA) protein
MSQLALLVDDVVVSIFPLDKPSMTIGRDTDCDIQIDESSVSGSHARLEIKPSEFLDGQDDIFLEDLGSTNGTMVNDEKIDRCQLKPDDVIEIGWNKFKLVDDSQGNRETTAFIGRV